MNKKEKIKKFLKELVVYGILALAISEVVNYFRAPKITSNKIANISGVTLNKRDVKEFLDKNSTLIIHFWGIWCPICRQEASNINYLAKNYNLLTIAVSSGEDSKIRAWLKEHNLNYPVLNDIDGSLAKEFKIKVFPTTLFFNSKGELKSVSTGYTTTIGLIIRAKLAKYF